MAGALGMAAYMTHQQPPDEIKRSCGLFGWHAEPYTCPTDESVPTHQGYICGSYGIINKEASPLQLAMYCNYQTRVNSSRLDQLWPRNAQPFHCSTESADCLPVQLLSYNQTCPPGATTKQTKEGTFCCNKEHERTTCMHVTA